MSATHLNNSRIMALEICGEYYRRKFEDKEQVPGTLRMHRGHAVHEVARMAHSRQIDAKALPQAKQLTLAEVLKHSLPTEEEAADVAGDAFDALVEEGVIVAPADLQDFGGAEKMAIGAAKDTAIDMATHYVSKVAPSIDPIAVERLITIKPQDRNVIIHGQTDLVERIAPSPEAEDQSAEEEQVSDLKSSDRTPKKSMADESQQLVMYAMLRKAETGKLPKQEMLRHVVKRKGSPWVEVHETTTVVTEQDVGALVHRVNVALDAIQKGVFVPADPGHWKCSARWCEFHPTCRFAMRRGK